MSKFRGHGAGHRALGLGWVLLALCAVGSSRAQTGEFPELDSSEGDRPSVFALIFSEYYPDLEFLDAPVVSSRLGLAPRYSIVPLSYKDERTWEFRDGRRQHRSPTKMLRNLPTNKDGHYLLSLSGLDMREVLKFQDLQAPEDRPELIRLLTRYISPDMDKYNRRDLEGYDPNMCLNASGDHVFSLGIDEGKLNSIRGKVRMFDQGRYEDYRETMLGYLEEFPRLSYLHVEIGNSYFAQGDLVRAQQWYRKGASANPLNPMLGYSMAFCHLAQGQPGPAVEALAGSVLACRNNLLAWLLLEQLLPGQGGRLADRRFRNRTQTGTDQALILVDKGVAQPLLGAWLYYGLAEIVLENPRGTPWMGFDKWEVEAVEMYKVAHLLGAYLVLQYQNDRVYDPYLESLARIHQAGLLREYILFEKIAPYAYYQRVMVQQGQSRQKMKEYLRRFVINR